MTGSEHHWLHDIYRRLYYVPIVLAALHRGFWGGLVLFFAVWVAYAPHAFLHVFEHDPTTSLEKVLEIILYFIVGVLCGELVDREETEREESLKAKKGERGAKVQLSRAHRLASLGELVAGIAHEIKNPLHTLRGTAEIVSKIVPGDKPESPMWALHQEELVRLERVAERFLSFARPTPPSFEPMQIGDVMARIRGLLEAEAKEKNIALEFDVPDKYGNCLVNVDRDQIVQVVIDVALNGFSAMNKDDNGSMRISCSIAKRNEQRRLVMSIQNTGPIIPPEDLERVFDPFFTSKTEGTGLGLSTASRIVEQHQGYIDVCNLSKDRGVRFSINLPVVKQPT
jgi:signal transduction histidine kinase